MASTMAINTPVDAAEQVDAKLQVTAPVEATTSDNDTTQEMDNATQESESSNGDTDSPQEMDATTPIKVQQAAVKAVALLKDSYQKVAEKSAKAQIASKAAVNSAALQLDIYYVEIKGGAMHIVAKLGGQIVYIKAKVTDVVGPRVVQLQDQVAAAKAHLDNAGGKVKGRLQDGYVYITTTAEGQVACIKAKALVNLDCMQTKMFALGEASKANVLQSYGSAVQKAQDYAAPVTSKVVAVYDSSIQKVQDFTAPVTSKVVAVYDSSKARAVSLRDASNAKIAVLLEPVKPIYVKAKNGVAIIVAKVGDTFVVVQVKIGEVSTIMHAQYVRSIAGARAISDGYISPFVNRAFAAGASVRSAVATRVEQITISLTNGMVVVKGKAGELISAFRMAALNGLHSTKQAVVDLVQKVASKMGNTMRFLGSQSKNGFLYIACQVNAKVVVIRIKVAEVVELARSKSIEMSKASVQAIADRCVAGKARALQALENAKPMAQQALETTKAKAVQVKDTGRDLAANPKARVTAASAAGGAVALGASGGAAGLLTGGALGAVCAVPAAFFTFGLSIPVGAFLGAGTGLCVGTAAGGSVGLVSGGAAGFGAHTVHANKDEIASKAKAYKAIASDTSNKLRTRVMASVSGTGGTIA